MSKKRSRASTGAITVVARTSALQKVFDLVVNVDATSIRSYVEKLREQNPGISPDDLAAKIVSRKALKNGLVGAATGLGGLISLPLSVPADVAMSWRIQASMVYAVAQVYGHTEDTTDMKTDLYLVVAGDSAKEVLKQLGIEVGMAVTRRMIARYVTREMMTRLWKVTGERIITKAGTRTLGSAMKWVPLVGAPIGFAFDWTATRAVGRYAIRYYSGRS
jgi:hypothetical protein